VELIERSSFMKTVIFLLLSSLVGGVAEAEGIGARGFSLNAAVGIENLDESNLRFPDFPSLSGSAGQKNYMVGRIGAAFNQPISKKLLVGFGVDWFPHDSDTKTSSVSSSGSVVETSKNSIRNRVSVFLTPRFVIDEHSSAYAKLGYTTADAAGVAQSDGFRSQVRADGYLLGLGYRRDLSERVYAFSEFEYHELGTVTDRSDPAVVTKFDIRRLGFSVGLGLKF